MLNLEINDGLNATRATYEAIYMDLNPGARRVPYPCMLYHDGAGEPLRCENTDEEIDARAKGYDNFTPAALSNRLLVNWFWDFEDMSPRQMVVFARDEYGVYLPIECGQVKLFKCLCELTKAAPQNRNRLILMAHTIAMNYDETLEEIKRAIYRPDKTANIEVEKWEVEL